MMFQIIDGVLKVQVDERPFGTMIRLRREYLGMSRDDVIFYMNGRVTATTLGNWETEFTLPSLAKLRKLSAALGLEVDILVRAWLLSRELRDRDRVVANAV